MNPLIGPFLYCVVVFSGCVLYFHYNCVDRRFSRNAQKTAQEATRSETKLEKAML